jgi:ankyrin repeat protein
MRCNAFESLQALLNAGADLTLKDKEDRTALAIAKEYDHPQSIELLESRSAPD